MVRKQVQPGLLSAAFHERDKERLAYYLQLAMPEYKAFVNPPLVCDPVPDVLVTGPTGIFVITVIDAEQVSYGGQTKRRSAGSCCPRRTAG